MAETDTDGEVPLLFESSVYCEMTREMIVSMLPTGDLAAQRGACIALSFSRSSDEAL
ncbi:MAG: hypothetical protein ABW085_03200 [Sedimenticola sp.]